MSFKTYKPLKHLIKTISQSQNCSTRFQTEVLESAKNCQSDQAMNDVMMLIYANKAR